MTYPSAENDALVKIREWVEDDGYEKNDDGYFDWPAPPEYTEYRVEGKMRADVLAKIGRAPDDPCTVRLIEGVIEGGYSEYTVEHDYPIEVWVDDDEGQSQRVFEHTACWSDDALAAFLKWVTPTAPIPSGSGDA